MQMLMLKIMFKTLYEELIIKSVFSLVLVMYTENCFEISEGLLYFQGTISFFQTSNF